MWVNSEEGINDLKNYPMVDPETILESEHTNWQNQMKSYKIICRQHGLYTHMIIGIVFPGWYDTLLHLVTIGSCSREDSLQRRSRQTQSNRSILEHVDCKYRVKRNTDWHEDNAVVFDVTNNFLFSLLHIWRRSTLTRKRNPFIEDKLNRQHVDDEMTKLLVDLPSPAIFSVLVDLTTAIIVSWMIDSLEVTEFGSRKRNINNWRALRISRKWWTSVNFWALAFECVGANDEQLTLLITDITPGCPSYISKWVRKREKNSQYRK